MVYRAIDGIQYVQRYGGNQLRGENLGRLILPKFVNPGRYKFLPS
jgi:hypothetical protein